MAEHIGIDSPGPNTAIGVLVDHIERCGSAVIGMIFHEIQKHGLNLSDHPFTMDYHDNKWWVYVEVNMRHASFDVEVSDMERYVALSNALSRVRRGFTHAIAS